MEKSREAEIRSPVATVENIQKRLLRPPLHSQRSSSSSFLASQSKGHDRIISKVSPQFDDNSYELRKKKRDKAKIQRLEDYLDPVLLSTIRAKVSGKRKNYGAEIKKKSSDSEVSEFDLFEWAGGDRRELKPFTGGGSRKTEISSRVKKEEENDAVDLTTD